MIIEKNKQYTKAIQSSKNLLNTETAYKNKDSLVFLKELSDFFAGLESSLRNEEASLRFISNGKKLDYVFFVSNTGYTAAFFYELEDRKINTAFVVALRTFITSYKWENSQKALFMHNGSYTFK